jgi:hypothetical protein
MVRPFRLLLALMMPTIVGIRHGFCPRYGGMVFHYIGM